MFDHFQTACLDRGVVLIHLKDAIFGTNEEIRSLSGNLVFLMIEGNKESKKLLEAVLPQVYTLYCLASVDYQYMPVVELNIILFLEMKF